MKIYLAARYSRRYELREYRDLIHKNNKKNLVISRWIDTEPAEDPDSRTHALKDVDDVFASDLLILFSEAPRETTRGGRHVEFGIAYALGLDCWVVGGREHIFHHLPRLTHFNQPSEMIEALM